MYSECRYHHDPDDGHEHSHHHHDHSPDHTAGSATFPVAHFLGYTLEHNDHHLEELHKLRAELEVAGACRAAVFVGRAIALYEQGNAELALAAKQL